MLTAALSVAAVVAVAPGRTAVGVVIALALLWSAVPVLTHLLAARRPGIGSGPAACPPASVTTIVRLGNEPLEVARTSILLALRAGPTVVVAAAAEVPAALRRLPVELVERETFEEGLDHALRSINTDALLIMSARAIPVAEACRAAAALLGDDVGWAIGRVRPFNRDGYAPDSREPVTTALHAAARSHGLVAWEPDATIIRTDLIRSHPIETARPLGAWLRARAKEGRRGVTVDEVVARRAAPVDASAYWPDAMSRQWGRVADLAGALTHGPLRTRSIAAGLIARELFALPLMVWIASPVLVGPSGAFPYRWDPAGCLALVAGVAMLRWFALRRALGLRARPARDVLSALHYIPGSFASAGALVTRRPPRSQISLPSRPLVWAALLLTIGTGYRLVDSAAVGVSTTTMALSLVTLSVLWIFSMGALAQRNWARSTFRIPLDLALTIDGVSMRSVNGSPSGLAVTGGPETPTLKPGHQVPMTARLDDGSEMTCPATVSGHRTVGGRKIVGLSLDLDDDAREAWVGQLSRAADRPSDPGSVLPREVQLADATSPSRIERAHHRVDVIVVAGAALFSLSIVAILITVMVGFRPLVIRSGSMMPTLSVGDVVLSEDVAASTLRVGEIANVPRFDADGTGSITHRVVAVERVAPGGVVRRIVVVTRGDTNSSDERTTLSPDSVVGRVRFTIPWVGRPATAVRTSLTQLVVAVAAMLVLVGALLRRPA